MLNNRLFFNAFGVECTDNLSIRGFGLFRVRLHARWWMDSSLYPEKGAYSRVLSFRSCPSMQNPVTELKSSDSFRYLGLDLFVLGKAALFELGEGEFAVDGDLESSAAGGNECEAFDILLELSQESVRQTDGLIFVASGRAVFNVDSGHVAPP